MAACGIAITVVRWNIIPITNLKSKTNKTLIINVLTTGRNIGLTLSKHKDDIRCRLSFYFFALKFGGGL